MVQDKQDQIELEQLRLENARLRQALSEAGIETKQAVVDRASSDAQQSTDVAISRAETSVARDDVRRTRTEASDAAARHSEQAKVAASALATSQALVAILQKQDRRQAALIELGECLRDLTDTAAIVAVGSEITARAVDATRAAYGEVDARRETVVIPRDWTAPGTTSIAGSYWFRDFGSYIDDLKRGETVVIDDAAADPRTSANVEAFRAVNIAALINVPLIERGTLSAIAIVQHEAPHTWTVEELAFVTAAGDRMRAAIARVEAEARQAILNGEIAHRLKNTLAVVQAAATQTLRNAATMDDARKILADRLVAIGNAHDALMAERTDATSINAVARGTLALHNGRGTRIGISGPEIGIGPQAAISLALMLHELATNAAKYGALSLEAGSVDLTWRVDPGPEGEHLFLIWAEENGPAVTPPTRRGFGTRLIEHGFGAGAKVDLRFEPTGVVAELRAPVSGLQIGVASH